MSEVQNGVHWLKINMSAGLLEALGGDSIPLPFPASRGHPLFLTGGPLPASSNFWHSNLCFCSHISSQSGHESLGTRGQTVAHPKMSTSQSPEPMSMWLYMAEGLCICEYVKDLLFKKKKIICLAALDLSCGKQDLPASSLMWCTDSLAVGTGSRAHRLSSCGTQAQMLHGMWNLSTPTRNWTHVPCIEGGF